TSRSFWRYWVSAIGKFIPKSGAECRVNHHYSFIYFLYIYQYIAFYLPRMEPGGGRVPSLVDVPSFPVFPVLFLPQ
ncbi:hypothetical protein ACV1DY_21645, partial [Aeromonas caviae]